MKYEIVKTTTELLGLYKPPMDLAVNKEMSKLDKHSIKFLSLSPFLTLSTSNSKGNMDCSPRGDYAGFVGVLDDYTIAIPDRPGNNRLDTLNNIIENPNVGLLVLVPGFNECLRINGSAKIVTNLELLNRFEYKGKLPKSIILVSITEVYFHCGKAITRSHLWKDESKVDRSIMPSLGRILMNQIDSSKTDDEIQEVEKVIEDRLKTTLY